MGNVVRIKGLFLKYAAVKPSKAKKNQTFGNFSKPKFLYSNKSAIMVSKSL